MTLIRTPEEKRLMEYSKVDCSVCNKPLSINVYQYSINKYGKALCYDHQKLEGSVKVTPEEDKQQAEEDYYAQD